MGGTEEREKPQQAHVHRGAPCVLASRDPELMT